MLFPLLYVRPLSRAQLTLQPSVMRVRNPAQYVETALAGADTSYVTGALSQTTTSLTARLDVTFTPALSLQLYAQPFISAGDYRTLGEVRAARARSLRERISNSLRRRSRVGRTENCASIAAGDDCRSRSTTRTSRCGNSRRTPSCDGSTGPVPRCFSCGLRRETAT